MPPPPPPRPPSQGGAADTTSSEKNSRSKEPTIRDVVLAKNENSQARQQYMMFDLAKPIGWKSGSASGLVQRRQEENYYGGPPRTSTSARGPPAAFPPGEAAPLFFTLPDSAGCITRTCKDPNCNNKYLAGTPVEFAGRFCRSLHDGFQYCELHIAQDEKFARIQCQGIKKYNSERCKIHRYSSIRMGNDGNGELAAKPLLEGRSNFCLFHQPKGFDLSYCKREQVQGIDQWPWVFFDLETGRLVSESSGDRDRVDVSLERVTEIGAVVVRNPAEELLLSRTSRSPAHDAHGLAAGHPRGPDCSISSLPGGDEIFENENSSAPARYDERSSGLLSSSAGGRTHHSRGPYERPLHFETLVRPNPTEPIVTPNVSGIENEMLQTAPDFKTAMRSFLQFLESCCQQHCEAGDVVGEAGRRSTSSTKDATTTGTTSRSRPLLIAHNGLNFDVQVLFHELVRHGMARELEKFRTFLFLDSRDVVDNFRPDFECRKLGCLGLQLKIDRRDYVVPTGEGNINHTAPRTGTGEVQLMPKNNARNKRSDSLPEILNQGQGDIASCAAPTQQASSNVSEVSIASTASEHWARPHRALSDSFLLRDVVLKSIATCSKHRALAEGLTVQKVFANNARCWSGVKTEPHSPVARKRTAPEAEEGPSELVLTGGWKDKQQKTEKRSDSGGAGGPPPGRFFSTGQRGTLLQGAPRGGGG
ncbi:unnamed protein product [Amoebophrya sp. A120]|nr:unnamed protein product [Amoebophrya sp. A120]|eukprot:GSA120T00007449001.1